MTPMQKLIMVVILAVIVGFFLFAALNRICECIEKIKVARYSTNKNIYDILGIKMPKEFYDAPVTRRKTDEKHEYFEDTDDEQR